jgi:DNA-nicking Smr family endonuclease
MSDENDSKSDDNDLFRRAVAGSRPLAINKVHPYRQRLSTRPRQRLADEQAVLAESLDPLSFEAEIDLDDEMAHSRPGVQKRVMDKLRRGQYRIEAELDLHRMTSEQAYEALSQFIGVCQAQHKRCVRVIHGKGLGSANNTPVLKHKVNHWLRRWDSILAFCPARRCDGGTGAVYILLRRNR